MERERTGRSAERYLFESNRYGAYLHLRVSEKGEVSINMSTRIVSMIKIKRNM